MECCFAPKRKNKPPTKEYSAFEPSKISQVRSIDNNNSLLIDDSENKQKLKKLSQLNFAIPEEVIPFPPKSPPINIAM